jgi:uncharacterized protein
MLKIRLRRTGTRNRPYYRIVVSSSRRTPGSEIVEELLRRRSESTRGLVQPRARAGTDREGRSPLDDDPLSSRAEGSGFVKELVETVALALAMQPESVAVTETEEGDTTTVDVTLASEDLGRIIGREGRTARALRALASAAGRKRNRRVVVRIRS